MPIPLPPFISAPALILSIVTLATAGVILRPWRIPEAIWPLIGGAVLLAFGLLSPGDALRGVAKGTDVYLFLTGMMLLGALAQREGLFDWLAAKAVRSAKGSALHLFALIYSTGVVVTVFLSNDATAVILTPAVAAVMRTADVKAPLPYLFICAFVANAASFVLPVSNPANLVMYGSHMPPLGAWLIRYALPSFVAIAATFACLYWTQRHALTEKIMHGIDTPVLTASGKLAAFGIILSAALLMAVSAADWQLGLPTCVVGMATAGLVLLVKKEKPWPLLADISWSILPLVAGLFVLVEALEHTDVPRLLAGTVRLSAAASQSLTVVTTAFATVLSANLMNNLPAGLITASALETARVADTIRSAALIGIDLGPNLSITGSLATLLWLEALRRDNQTVGAWAFLKLGIAVTLPTLCLTVGTILLTG